MKKAFDQTVRDLKRGVNKKVLKVPHIEQKILDATSNEPWGPHGSLLADIAQATRNYHEYQMIMNVIWKRINDTGKNWRHVYKALTVLDYLVAHGSERVIDDIREHSYQIGTLSDFQYIDSNGRDQGQNVRRKSQSLVSLVNNKERIQEVRQKAAANREKYGSSFSTGGGNRAGSYPGPGGNGDRYNDDRYGDHNGYGREREKEYYRDEERYGRGGSDPYNRHGREYEESYNGRDTSYRDKDDEYKGSQNSNYSDGYPYAGASRSRNSFDRERDHPYDDDDRYSTRSAGGGRADDSHDDRRIERKLSEPNIAAVASPPAPPSYEDAIRDSPVPFHVQRDGEHGSAAVAPRPESIPAVAPESAPASVPVPTPTPAPAPASASATVPAPVQTPSSEPLSTQTNTPVDGFDEFDPRGSFSAVPVGVSSAAVPDPSVSAVSSLEMDFFGSDPISSLALVPMTTTTATDDHAASINSGFEADSFASMPMPAAISSPFDQVGNNPFGDAPFKAIPQDDNFSIPPTMPSAAASGASSQAFSAEPTSAPVSAPRMEAIPSLNFGDAFGDMNFNSNSSGNGDVLGAAPFVATTTTTTAVSSVPAATGSAPTLAPAPVSQPQFAPTSTLFGSLQQNQYTPGGIMQTNQFAAQAPHPAFSIPTQQGFMAPQAPTTPAFVNPSLSLQAGQPQPATAFMDQTRLSSGNNFSMLLQPANQSTLFSFESAAPQAGIRLQSQAVPLVQSASQSQPGNFETKSSVWADTLSRGLVNLNISGSKINPHADIGVDFDTMNRKEKREEKKSAAPAVVSTVTMGKAMGAGSGIGRAGAGGMATPRNPMVGSGMGGMGMGMGMGAGMGMGMGSGLGMLPMGSAGSGGGYGGMNQPMGMGMGGMGGMGGGPQGMPMRPMGGMPPGAPGIGYNPMMGPGAGFGTQQPYGSGGFR